MTCPECNHIMATRKIDGTIFFACACGCQGEFVKLRGSTLEPEELAARRARQQVKRLVGQENAEK